MSLSLAPNSRRWSYAQLCRRWFAHYPAPFLSATSHKLGALLTEREQADIKGWLGTDYAASVARSNVHWPMPSARYWESLPQRRFWRVPTLTGEEQQSSLMLAEALMAAEHGFSHASSVHARQGLKHLPDDIPAPRVIVYLDGFVGFWWQARQGQGVFVKFLPDGGLHYQYYNGDDDPVGYHPRWKGRIDGWNPGWPQGILDVLRVLYGGKAKHS